MNNNELFRDACKSNNLELAKLLYENNDDIDLSINYEIIFQNACKSNNLELVKWLLEIKPDFDISINDDIIFKNACVNNHVALAKWLRSLDSDKYNLLIENNYIYSYSVNKEDTCSICMTNMPDTKTVCNHMFCNKCITTWLMKKRTCPACGMVIRF